MHVTENAEPRTVAVFQDSGLTRDKVFLIHHCFSISIFRQFATIENRLIAYTQIEFLFSVTFVRLIFFSQ